MAQITLSRVGGAIGQRLLPGSFSILGRRISGATLGRLAGRAAEDYFFADEREGPRLTELHVMESREGVGIPNVYGRTRVAGQLIWAGDFKERRDTGRQGKGGPEVTSYSYTVSFAVAVCEGPNAQIERAWSNGEPLSLGAYTHRIYNGGEDQVPDPIIEAHEGFGFAPAYKGLCYIVFEDVPLEDFGNRIPQLSFEVTRSPGVAGSKQVADVVKAVNIIPATGEFVYATEPVSVRTFPGRQVALNVNADPNRTDFELSLDQLQQGLPNVTEASLTVAWFGDDLRAEHCAIRPGVETRDRETVPLSWRVGPTTRANAHLVSQTDDGHAYYGGTPSDDAVVQGIAEMTSRGIAVTLTPFLLMDVPLGSVQPMPDGSGTQPPFPWRGRISSEHSGTLAISNTVTDFLGGAEPSDFSLAGDQVAYAGDPNDWGYRRFILHHAYLGLLAGGVDGFLIGTEMRGATWLHDGQGGFPFVDGLCQLADEVKTILGPACQVSYAADWSEYGAYVPGDGSGNVYFPLDTLWGRPSIDYVGIDWYPPAGDWRDGESHLDWQTGYRSPGEAAYLVANQTGGDGFDWYYASQADRDAQIRTPIIDTAHGEDWVFRVKDLDSWWTAFHHERPAGLRDSAPTDWVPGSKPIRLSEIGFPAVDKSTNSPNLFFDPKSSESAVPPYSSGERDDVLQAAALSAVLAHWQAQPFISGAAVWAWDARPFPAFPARTDIWSDGENWRKGHWLNGRTGLSSLTAVLDDLGGRAGVTFENGLIDGIVPGYATYGETRLNEAIQPLATAFGLSCSDARGGIGFTSEALLAGAVLADGQFVERPPDSIRQTSDVPPSRLTLLYSSIEDGYEPATADVRAGEGGGPHASVKLPLALSAPQAELVARNLLTQAQIRDGLEVSVPTCLAAEVMVLRLDVSGYEGVFRLRDVTIGESATLELERSADTSLLTPATDVPSIGNGTSAPSEPDLLLIDARFCPEISTLSPWSLLHLRIHGPEVCA